MTGDVGVSPIDSSALTGFGLSAMGSHATSSLVVGLVYAADYPPPTPAKMTTAISDMETAYTDAKGRSSDAKLNQFSGDLAGQTLAPGLYKWSTGLLGTGSFKFSGSSTDTWILQIAEDLKISNAAKMTLEGGAKAQNIFWQVSGSATFGSTSHMEGVILGKTSIVFETESSLNGAALAQTEVTLDATTINKQSSAGPTSSDGGGGRKKCFSEKATVQVLEKGTIQMKDLAVGDKILTGSGKYTDVYAFGHYEPNKTTNFLQIYTQQHKAPLEITGDHLHRRRGN